MHLVLAIAIPVALVLAFALYVQSRPSAFRITRSLVIAAPPSAIFPLLHDFRAWARWSPWEKLDPDMTKTYGGADAGVGATYHWQGKKSGEGKMTITESESDRRLVIALDFIKPFPANNTTIFTVEPDGEGTRVTWTMEGESNFASKAFGVFVNMDAMVGRDFETGLAAISTIASAPAA